MSIKWCPALSKVAAIKIIKYKKSSHPIQISYVCLDNFQITLFLKNLFNFYLFSYFI